MAIRYVHTNLVAHNWKKLADFYISVFNCRRIPPERNLQGEWLDKGTGVKNAAIQGIHLLLPGYDENGPTLEIFQYGNNTSKPTPAANRAGFSHIAFSVDNVEETLEKILQHGGSRVGEIAQKRLIERLITFVYATDPEGNIIEIHNWKDLQRFYTPSKKIDSYKSILRR